jgi:3-isopropylmalate/(R)-2-methylmalate dehydratase small subunit
MESFTVLSGVAASMVIPNITTDAMSPTLAALSTSADLGAMLFANWRYDLQGVEKPDFVLNREPFRQAKILVAGPNFGCGSSRERAVWSLMKFGISCVIAPSFADIFRDNAFQNGLLPIALGEADFEAIRAAVEGSPEPVLIVDLQSCTITLPDGATIRFEVPAERRAAMLDALEEIDVILRLEQQIDAFQLVDAKARPWIYAAPA